MKSFRLLIFIDIEGQKVAHTTQVTYFKNALKIHHFIYPNFLFDQRVAEIILFLRSIVSQGKVMYQSDFLSREFSQNSAVDKTVEVYKFKNSVKNSS